MKSNLQETFVGAGVSLALGAGRQLAANYDAKKAATTTKWYKKVDNYVCFGIPAVALAASFVDLPIDRKYTDKALVLGSVLAGIKIVEMMTKKNYQLVYTGPPATRNASGRPAPWAPANRPAPHSTAPYAAPEMEMAGVVLENRGM